MEITAIQMSRSATSVTYSEAHETQKMQIVYTDAKNPDPAFAVAYGNLVEVVNDIIPGLLRLPVFNKVSVSKVNYRRSAAGAIGVIISLCVEVQDSNRPWNFNTPLKFCLAAGQDATETCLSGKSANILNELLSHAQAFTQGVVAQTQLDFTEPEPDIDGEDQ